MEIKEIKTIKLEASEGMRLTNGEVISSDRYVYLGVNDSPDNWYEISVEEAQAIEEKQLEEMENNNT
jgi:hypothetical protein